MVRTANRNLCDLIVYQLLTVRLKSDTDPQISASSKFVQNLRKRFLKYAKFTSLKSTRRISHWKERCQEEINRKVEPVTHPTVNHGFVGICTYDCLRSGTNYFPEWTDIRSAPRRARIQPSLFHPHPRLGKPFLEGSAAPGFSG